MKTLCDFIYNGNRFNLSWCNLPKGFPVVNQTILFDCMNELKIDYRGLIESGLAIDANTLKANPYK
jgi:hypothetical protein